ncbi:MAG: hypothetical protein ABDH66_05100 [Bacteroidia bacterium]
MRFGPVRLRAEGLPEHGHSVYLHLEARGLREIAPADEPPRAEISVGWVDMLSWTRQPAMSSAESLHSLAERARRGGITHLFVGGWTGWHDPSVLAQVRAEVESLPVWIHCLATWATPEGYLAPVESLRLEGAAGWTLPPHQSIPWRTLVQALPYLRHLGGVLLVLPFWEAAPGEMGVSETPLLALSGWRGIPEWAESIAIHALAALHQAYGGRMLIGPLTSAAGHKIACDYGLSSFTTISYLIAHAGELLAYDPFWKLHPPLRGPEDQRALAEAAFQGQLHVASGDILAPPEEKNLEWTAAAIGQPTVDAFAPLLWKVGSQFDSGGKAVSKLVWLLSEMPRRFLGLAPFKVEVGMPLDFTVFRIEENSYDLPPPWNKYSSTLRVMGTIRSLADAYNLQSQMS